MKETKKKTIYIIILFLVIITLISAGTYARYIGNSIWDYYIESRGFYFFSEQLDGGININNNWKGTSVGFEVKNFNENNEVSDFKIEYQLTCTIKGENLENYKCYINGTENSIYTGVLETTKICRNDTDDGVDSTNLDEETCISRGYSWIDGNTSINNFFEVKSDDHKEIIKDVSVEIEAKALSPYSKTLKGEFQLTRSEETEDEILFEHQTYSNYEKVIITNNTYKARTFFLRWDPNEVSIAKGDYFISGISEGQINEIEFKVETDDTITYSFYKKNDSDTISIENFDLVEKPESAAIKVTGIELVSLENNATEIQTATFTNITTKINLNLPQNSSKFSYKVTIENTTADHYYLKKMDHIVNTANAEIITTGMSLYHEFSPGTLSTFYITYEGISNLTSSELILDILFDFELGEIYKDDTLNGSNPEIIDGLIPISYNETLEKWIKADVVNGEWYDYSTIKWANATSVIPSMKEYYVKAEPGVVVEMSHITSMYVWIPRYSYTIRETLGFQGYGGSSIAIETPGAIDIKFGDTSMVDTGSGSYEGITPENYYTSSAFCWGNTCDDPEKRFTDEENTEISGFWIAKFEASKVANILYSKPNMKPMTNYTIKDTFYYVQELMNGTNGYNNYGYVGYVDAHLIKNTEWGAIAYLSQSEFGKYGNINYTGGNKEIYINNCSTYITGIGGSTPHQGSNTSTCTTNTYETYYGMGASTTGNIYGVYDMVGGTFDRVMGILLGPNGEIDTDLSGFTSLPEGRYINIYPSGTYTLGDTSPIKGDALTETINYYSDRYLGDPRFAASYYDYHWLYRGGSLFFSNTDANGIFSYTLFTGQADGHHSSRFTITMYGSLVSNL